jgi:cytochrome b pre-mRNA-processing protein 3
MAAIASFLGLPQRGRHERVGFQLYGAAVAAARDPYLYATLGVPDTLDGRFDLIGLHACLLIRRLRHAADPGPALAQAVFDAMFADMDINLRELGVGDMSIGKRVRAMWEAFHGRAAAYEAAMDEVGNAKLAEAIARNVWRNAPPPAGAADALARLARAQDAHLAVQPLARLALGEVGFLAAEEAAP